MDADSLVNILERCGLGPAHKLVRNVVCKCPWRHTKHDVSEPTSGRSFSVKIEKDGPSVYYCYACGARGVLISLVSQFDVFSDEEKEAIATLERMDLKGKVHRSRNKFQTLLAPPPEKECVTKDEAEFVPFAGKIPDYAAERGLSYETCKKLGLGFDEDDQRLVFPIRCRPEGKLIGMVGRAIHPDQQPRYMNYWGFQKNWLYREEQVVGKRAVVFEGPVDTALAFQKGVEEAVGLLGARATDGQIETLATFEEVIICLDGDAAGYEGTKYIARQLFGRCRLKMVVSPPGEEPSELDEEKLRERIANAELILTRPPRSSRKRT